MITDETKKIIIDGVDTLLSKITQAVYIGLCEDMGPNDIDFDEMYELRLEDAQEYLFKVLEGEV